MNKIIKDKTITQDHILSFVRNSINETLLITSIHNPSIIKYIQFKKFSSPNSDYVRGGRFKAGEEVNHEIIIKDIKEN